MKRIFLSALGLLLSALAASAQFSNMPPQTIGAAGTFSNTVPGVVTNTGGFNTNPPAPTPFPVSVWAGTNSDPNGVYTAGYGSLYNQFDATGTNFVAQWIKHAAAGNTGWVVAPAGGGNTNALTAAQLAVINPMVTNSTLVLSNANFGMKTVMASTSKGLAIQASSAAGTGQLSLNTNGDMTVYGNLTAPNVQTNGQVRTVFEFRGDSITSTNPVTGTNTWDKYLTRGLGRLLGPVKTYNFAIAGDFMTNELTEYATNGHLVLPTNQTYIVFLLKSINDSGSSSNALISTFTNLASEIHADGKLLDCIIPYEHDSFSNSADQEAYWAWLRTATNWWDFCCDLENNFSPQFETGDHLHPNAPGAQHIARLVAQSLLSGQLLDTNTIVATRGVFNGSGDNFLVGTNNSGNSFFVSATGSGIGMSCPGHNGWSVYNYLSEMTFANPGAGYMWNDGPSVTKNLMYLDNSGNLTLYSGITKVPALTVGTNSTPGYMHVSGTNVFWSTVP